MATMSIKETDARLDGKFRIVIPEEIRRTARLSKGERLILRYEVKGRQVQLTIVPAKLVPAD